jgi:lamin tail-like protein
MRSTTLTRLRLILPAALALFIFVFLGLEIFFARRAQAISTTIVISEFRTRGPSGANDEFVELYNVTGTSINIGGWKINRSNGAGTINTQVTITAGTTIPAFGHFWRLTALPEVTAAAFQ